MIWTQIPGNNNNNNNNNKHNFNWATTNPNTPKYLRVSVKNMAVSSVRGSGVKVLYGSQISCNETADDMDWLFVKKLMIYIGRVVFAIQLDFF